MREKIERYLTNCGYTNIEWHVGRYAYITATRYGLHTAVDVFDLVAEMARKGL